MAAIQLNASSYQSLLFHGNCVTCHHETEDISAPSIIQLKSVYLSAFPQKEEFVDYMAGWVQYPNTQTSLMDGAIKKYELMPELGFDLFTLKNIAEYIYDTDFTKPHEGHRN